MRAFLVACLALFIAVASPIMEDARLVWHVQNITRTSFAAWISIRTAVRRQRFAIPKGLPVLVNEILPSGCPTSFLRHAGVGRC